MRRTASEVLRQLEMRVARLENRSASMISIDSALDSIGEEIFVTDMVQYRGAEFSVESIGYDSNTREKVVVIQSGRKTMTVPVNDVLLVEKVAKFRVARLEKQSGSDLFTFLNHEVDNLAQALQEGKMREAKTHARNLHNASEGIKTAIRGAMQSSVYSIFGETMVSLKTRSEDKFTFGRITKNIMESVDAEEEIESVFYSLPSLKNEIKNLKTNQDKMLATFKDLLPL